MNQNIKRPGKLAKCIRFLGKYSVSILTVSLLLASGFFIMQVNQLKASLRKSHHEVFKTGDRIRILEILDGDEMLIKRDEGSDDLAAEKGDNETVVRLLGIKSFNPSVSDPLLSQYGKICFQYLKARAEGQMATIDIPEKRLGGRGRLIGTVFLKDSSGAFTVDLAGDLIEKGYTLVYTKYDFDNMEEYLRVQADARERLSGFWSNAGIAAKADSLNLIWQEGRTDD